MTTPRDTAIKLKQDFDSLMGKYQRMTKLLVDGLAPDVPQEQRNELRKLFTPFTKAPPGAKKPDVERGDTALE